jgi:hypothetical protein
LFVFIKKRKKEKRVFLEFSHPNLKGEPPAKLTIKWDLHN